MRHIILIPIFLFVFFLQQIEKAHTSPFDQQFKPNTIDLEVECARMYSLRESNIHYPEDIKKSAKYCQVKTKGAEYTVSSQQFYKYAHKTLRFVCKGKRPILLDLISSISGCDGQTRHLTIIREQENCFLYTQETDDPYLIPKENITELKKRMSKLDFFDQIAFERAGDLVKVAIEEVMNC